MISTVAILTANRPDTVARGLRSYVRHCKDHGRNVDFLVADQSASIEARERCRTSVHALASELGATIRWFGLAERASFIEQLSAAAAIDPSLVAFALKGSFDGSFEGAHAIGGNRNTILLLTAGEQIFMTDDDTVCAPTSVAGSTQRQLVCTTAGDPTVILPCEDLASAARALPRFDGSLLGEHDKLLGRVVADFPSRLVSIYLTWTGIVGDSGYTTPLYLLSLPATAHRGLVERSAESFRAIAEGRIFVRFTERPTVNLGGLAQSAAIGLDNRTALAPFSPAFRGEDMLLIRTMRALHEGTRGIGYVPITIEHRPPEERALTYEGLWGRGTALRLMDLLAMILPRSLSHAAGDDEDARAARLANALRARLAEPAALLAYVEREWREVLEKRLAQARARARASADAPAFFREALVERCAALERAVARAGPLLPVEFAGAADARSALFAYLRRFADLIEVWPHLHRTARNRASVASSK